MKIKKILIVLLVAVILGIVYYCYNFPLGKPIRVTIEVIDDKGVPIENARIKGYFNNPSKHDDTGTHYDVLTNQSGLYKVLGVGYSFTECTIEKDGYYTSRYYLKLKQNDEFANKLTVVLKKIRNPVAMQVRQVEVIFPGLEEYYPFDLDLCDWVEPHGNGKKANIYIYYYRDAKGMFTGEWVLKMKTENPEEGFRKKDFDTYSKFKTIYQAPEIGYTNMLEFISETTAKEVLINTKLKKNEYLIFKVQNSTNSAVYNYGKICQPFLYGPDDNDRKKFKLWLTYYYNPTPGDRNLEFDPKQNLITTVDRRGRDNSDRFDP